MLPISEMANISLFFYFLPNLGNKEFSSRDENITWMIKQKLVMRHHSYVMSYLGKQICNMPFKKIKEKEQKG